MALAARQVPRVLALRCTARTFVRTAASCQNLKWNPLVQSAKTSLTCNDRFLTKPSSLITLTNRFMSSDEFAPDKVKERVMSCLKLYDKIKPEMLAEDSHFIKDLGLDSLDHVEIIVAIENEFALEIPDDAAETLLTPTDIVKYICESADAIPS